MKTNEQVAATLTAAVIQQSGLEYKGQVTGMSAAAKMYFDCLDALNDAESSRAERTRQKGAKR